MQLSDFGYTFQYCAEWMKNNFLNVEVSFWGLETTIGIIFAWCFFGSIILNFIRSFIGYYVGD